MRIKHARDQHVSIVGRHVGQHPEPNVKRVARKLLASGNLTRKQQAKARGLLHPTPKDSKRIKTLERQARRHNKTPRTK